MTRRDNSGGMSASHASGKAGAGGNNRGGNSPPVSPLEELMRRKGVDDAWAALEEMQSQGLTTDRFTVSRMLMKTVGDGRNKLNAQRVYKGLFLVERFIQYQPEEADEVLFNALLDTCCRIQDLNRLEATVQKMRELQILPSHVTLGILVKAYGQARDITRVLKIWEEMDEQRRHANAVTYGCMIDACVKCGRLENAMEIFYDMKRRRKHRNTILYTTLIKGCGLEKDLRSALTLFREMRDEGVPYNTISYNSIIDVCIKCADLVTAEDLLREMLAPGSNNNPDLVTYSTLLKGYCHTGDLDKALQVAETIKACGFKCDELVYNTLMDGCVKANDLSAGIGLFAEMTQAGLKPSSITHSILVRLYQRNGYKGNCFDTVAQLYQHHGLDSPDEIAERGGKSGGGGGGRRGDRFRNGQNNSDRFDRFRSGDQTGGRGAHASGAHPGNSWANGIPDVPIPRYPGALPMQPPTPNSYPGSLPPQPHMSGAHGPGLMPSREADFDFSRSGPPPQTSPGGSYGMSVEAMRGHHPHMPPMGHPQMPLRGVRPIGPEYGPPGAYGNMEEELAMGMYMNMAYSPTGPPPPFPGDPLLGHGRHPAEPQFMGTSLEVYPRGRLLDDGFDAPRNGPPLDHNLLPWFQSQGGLPDMPYPVSMPPGVLR
jgi:pentatricopeptide repeat protein